MDSALEFSEFHNRPASLEERHLYSYFTALREQESSEAVLQRFEQLFFEGVSNSEEISNSGMQALTALSRIVGQITRQDSRTDFKFILNRCCYTLINYWHLHRQDEAVVKLVDLFDRPASESSDPLATDLQQLLQEFRLSSQFKTLQRLPHVLREESSDPTLRSLLRRYPSLYECCLLTPDSESEQKENIQKLRRTAQRQFETNLARYDNRRAGRSRVGSANNPTLLPNPELDQALIYYLEARTPYQNSAQRLLAEAKLGCSYQEFKEELSLYLIEPIADVNSNYVNTRLQPKLRQFLQNVYTDYNADRLFDTLLMNTCRCLLKFFIVDVIESEQSFMNGRRFIDCQNFFALLTIGASYMMGLLLKIVHLCRSVRPWLENRFALLFTHYESRLKTDMSGLITSLEHLNVALSTHFGEFSFRTAM